MLKNTALPSRRFTSRVETPPNVWVDWPCAGIEDISRVGNISLGGLFIETRASKGLGSTVKLEFLVQEGQIRADGVVKRVDPGLRSESISIGRVSRDCR
jgi:PilZ domain-containing protein